MHALSRRRLIQVYHAALLLFLNSGSDKKYEERDRGGKEEDKQIGDF